MNNIRMDTIPTYDILSGIFVALCIVITMKFVPIFHGYDSNDVKRVIFEDENNKQYILEPYYTQC